MFLGRETISIVFPHPWSGPVISCTSMPGRWFPRSSLETRCLLLVLEAKTRTGASRRMRLFGNRCGFADQPAGVASGLPTGIVVIIWKASAVHLSTMPPAGVPAGSDAIAVI